MHLETLTFSFLLSSYSCLFPCNERAATDDVITLFRIHSPYFTGSKLYLQFGDHSFNAVIYNSVTFAKQLRKSKCLLASSRLPFHLPSSLYATTQFPLEGI